MKRALHFLFTIIIVFGVSAVAKAQAPVANFSATPLSSCTPLIVQFTDLSTGSPTSWSWNLGNGTTSTLQNPSTTYTVAGTYTITLTATNANGSNTKVSTNYITVSPAPTVNFVANDSIAGCGFKTITVTNLTNPNTPGAASYYWDFGDGYTSSAQSPPAHTYVATGTYNLSLVVTNSMGCTKSLTKPGYMQVLTKPVSGFTAANTNTCAAPITTTFTNTSTGGATYQWDFGDGGTSATASPTHTYTTTGSFNVRLIVTSTGGCKDTFTQTSLVNVGSLTAGFTSNARTTCTRNPLSFTNTTIPGGGGSMWNFGDGGTSTQVNPVHTYAAAGTYIVRLVVAYSNCSDSTSDTITVAAGPSTAFSGASLSACSVPHTASFSNSTSGAASYLWDFGDGATSTSASPSHTYSTLGTYTVKLISTSVNGCTDTLIKPAYVVIAAPTATLNTNPYIGCAPASAAFTATVNSIVPVSSYVWSYGDGSTAAGGVNAGHTYLTSGTYTVTVTMTTSTGCVFTASQNVIVGSHTTPAFSASPTTVCFRSGVSFTNATAGGATSYLWLFGDGQTSTQINPIYIYSVPGIFTVKLISSANGCTDTLTRTNYITVNPPKAEFSFVYSCTNRKQFTFTNASIGATSYSWNFGDGGTDTVSNPVHTYATYGTYSVRLIATSSVTGCIDTIIKQVSATTISAAFYAADSFICKGAQTGFTAAAGYSSYTWDFGLGYPSYSQTPIPTFANTGLYTVKLVVRDAQNCADSLTKTNYINVHKPTASFTQNPGAGCGQIAVTYTDNSVPSSGSAIISRVWDFGDGTTLTTAAASVTHSFLLAGTYAVQLTITETGGCTDVATLPTVIVINRPVAAFTSPDTLSCKNGVTRFFNTTTGTGSITYSWDFGDGSTSAAVSPSHVYTTVGTYTVRLIASINGGCSDTSIKLNYIKVSTVHSGFTMSDSAAPCPPFTVSFTNASTGAASYLWIFGNGGNSTLANPSAAFTTSGTFTVRLIAINASGCRDTSSRTLVIGTGPSGTFSYPPTTGCSPVSIVFSATSSGSTSLTYDFGNGVTNTTSATSVTYSYTTPGVFRPTLIISNSTGCNTFVVGTDSITVGKANAGFSISAITTQCARAPVQFTDTSSAVASTISTRNWNFGDGGTSTAINPTHAYTTAGTYTARLIVTTVSGCKDTIYRNITINPLPVVAAAGQTICGGKPVQLNATGAATYSWSPATGLSCTTCANPVASPASSATYTITGTSAAGCIGTGTVLVAVNPTPVVSAGSPVAICSGSSATLTATGATTYSWSPSTNLSCTSCASPVASPTATITYVVAGTTNGCSDTNIVTVTVNPTPVLTVTPNLTICAGGTAALTASGATTYSWSPSTGLSCTTCANPNASPAATTAYTVTGTTNGCSATATITVAVTPIAVVTIAGTNTICMNAATALTASGATSYSWSPAAGLSCTACANPTANPAATTTYTVTGTSGVGCTGTTTYTITVNPLPSVNAGPDTAICAGSATSLTASGAVTYAWSPAAGLSCTACASPTASPAATTAYIATGTSAAGCVKSDTVIVTVNPLPTISAGGNTSVCPGGSATLTATGGASYVWSPGATLSCTACASPVATPSATVTYTVTGTGSNGCKDTSRVTVAVNGIPAVTVTGSNAICIGSSTTLTASGANSFSWSPATGLSCTACANPTANPAATTTYTITGTSGVGCTGTTTFTVTVNPLPVVSAGADTAICLGSAVTLTASGATNYGWSPATGLSATTGTSVVATPVATTTYTVTGTNGNGCVKASNVTVTVNPLPAVSAGANTSICPGGSAALSATGAATYSWTPSATLSCASCAGPIATPSATTTYTVTGTSAAGCRSSSAVTVSVNSTPVITVPGATICAGSSTTLTATGANSFVWSPATNLSSTTGGTVTANPVSTTTYTVTGTSGVGCTGTTTVTVTVNPLPVVAVGPDATICAGASVTLTATGAASYSWSPTTGLSATTGASTIATPGTTTTYIVTGRSAAGCTNSASVTVTVNALPVVSAGNNTAICPTGAATLTATGAATYVWTPSATLSCAACASPVARPSVTTTYTVVGTGSNGCSTSSTVTVTVNQLPVVTVSGKTSLCTGDTTVLTASGAGSYSWSPASTLSCANCTTTTASPKATTTYTVVGTSGVGCVGTANVVVTMHPLPTVTVDTPQASCMNVPVQLTAYGGTSTYSWTPATGLSCTTCSNPVATPPATTTYTVRVTDIHGCSSQAQTTLGILPLPPVYAGPDVSSCKFNSVTLNASGAVSYLWSPAIGLSCTTCASPVATSTLTTTYTVTGTGTNGCKASDSVKLNVHAQPPVNAGPDQTICAGGSAQLQASGAIMYVWTPAFDLSCTTCANPLATPANTMTYMVSGTDVNGCRDSDLMTIHVIQHNPVSVDTGGDFCLGGSIKLYATGGDNYIWSPASSLSCKECSNPVASPITTTTYSVIIRQGYCFADTLRTTVVIHPLPTVNAGPDQSIILGSTAQLNATGTNISRYAWTPSDNLSCADCPNPVSTPAVSMTYVVTATSDFGCTASDDVKVSVRCDGTQVWMPNTFTPNADGENDFFYPHGKGISHITRFRIYDRWGELLFDRMNMPVNDRDQGWNGTYKNQVLKPDVYVWILNATCTNGEPLELKGDISLVR